MFYKYLSFFLLSLIFSTMLGRYFYVQGIKSVYDEIEVASLRLNKCTEILRSSTK